jgi:hypothetical protein
MTAFGNLQQDIFRLHALELSVKIFNGTKIYIYQDFK